MVDSKFGKDTYLQYMQELLASRESDVKEYHGCFEDIRHKLLVHNLSLEEIFFVSKLLDGLKLDIKLSLVLCTNLEQLMQRFHLVLCRKRSWSDGVLLQEILIKG